MPNLRRLHALLIVTGIAISPVATAHAGIVYNEITVKPVGPKATLGEIHFTKHYDKSSPG